MLLDKRVDVHLGIFKGSGQITKKGTLNLFKEDTVFQILFFIFISGGNTVGGKVLSRAVPIFCKRIKVPFFVVLSLFKKCIPLTWKRCDCLDSLDPSHCCMPERGKIFLNKRGKKIILKTQENEP